MLHFLLQQNKLLRLTNPNFNAVAANQPTDPCAMQHGKEWISYNKTVNVFGTIYKVESSRVE